MADNKKYTPSQAVQAALEAVEEQKNSRPGEYRSAWEEQLQGAMEKILNRQAFHYNLNGDALYQQYRDQAVRTGRLAMMDTMGQAAALTRGYGNSYAQNAGQQAYHQELASLNDRIPELYAMALDQYYREGDDLLRRYELLSGRENQDYGRYQDTMSAWQKEANRLWGVYSDERGFDYDAYRDTVGDDQWQMEFNEAKRRYDQKWQAEHPTAKPGTDTKVVYQAANSTAANIKKTNEERKRAAVPKAGTQKRLD